MLRLCNGMLLGEGTLSYVQAHLKLQGSCRLLHPAPEFILHLGGHHSVF